MKHLFPPLLFSALFVFSAFADVNFYVEEERTRIVIDDDGTRREETITVTRPMRHDEFSKLIENTYGGDYIKYADEIESLEDAWNVARRQWNNEHPDEQIAYNAPGEEDDGEEQKFDDEDEEESARLLREHELTEEEIRDILEGKEHDPKEGGDKDDDGNTYNPSRQEKAIKDDEDDYTSTSGTKDTAKLEGADGETESYSFDILSGGVNTDSKSIAGLFNGLDMLPFVDETDKEAKRLTEGYDNIDYSQQQTIKHSKSINNFAATHPGWVRIDGSNAGSVNWAIFAPKIRVGAEIDNDIDEPDNPPDWGALPEAPDNYLDEAPFSSFKWDFGGFKGGDAVLMAGAETVGGPVIGDLKMGKDGLSFHYEEGLSSWGLEHTDASALACLFVMNNDGEWVGGKFDWISTSRQTRDFENIYTGYHGWDLSNVPKSTTVAFVIVSKDGKKRSNVITARWDR